MKKILILFFTLTLPMTTFAASDTIASFINKVVTLINAIIPILIAVATLLFFYHSGMGIFGGRSGDATSQTKLKETLLWGIGIIFVMVSIAGILNMLAGSLDLNAAHR